MPMLTVYSTTWCGYCYRLRSQLDREGIGYRTIDIERDESAAAFVESVNGGNQTVPTVRFPDGTTLTNPTLMQVKAHMATLSN
jgi:mycoredoxin